MEFSIAYLLTGPLEINSTLLFDKDEEEFRLLNRTKLRNDVFRLVPKVFRFRFTCITIDRLGGEGSSERTR